MADKKGGTGGKLPNQTGTTQKGGAAPGQSSKPVTPNPGVPGGKGGGGKK